jgi:hypothetical protein
VFLQLLADVLTVSEDILGDQKVASFAVQRERTATSISRCSKVSPLSRFGLHELLFSQLLADVFPVSMDI